MTEAPTESPYGSPAESPFGDQNGDIQTITLMRIYDVLLGLYREANPDAARDLLELHLGGVIVGPQPAFSGTFVTSEINSEQEDIPVPPDGDYPDDV